MPARRSRPRTALAAVVVLAAGLAVTRLGLGAAGDVLYALLVAVLVALVAPTARATVAAAGALAWCVLVELAQLTELPAHAVQSVPLLRYVLGTTFVATDLLAYAAGAACFVVVDRCLRPAHGADPGADEGAPHPVRVPGDPRTPG